MVSCIAVLLLSTISLVYVHSFSCSLTLACWRSLVPRQMCFLVAPTRAPTSRSSIMWLFPRCDLVRLICWRSGRRSTLTASAAPLGFAPSCSFAARGGIHRYLHAICCSYMNELSGSVDLDESARAREASLLFSSGGPRGAGIFNGLRCGDDRYVSGAVTIIKRRAAHSWTRSAPMKCYPMANLSTLELGWRSRDFDHDSVRTCGHRESYACQGNAGSRIDSHCSSVCLLPTATL